MQLIHSKHAIIFYNLTNKQNERDTHTLAL